MIEFDAACRATDGPHVFIQLLTFSGSNGVYCRPEHTYEHVREVGNKEGRGIYTYHYIVMCQHCCQTRKVSHRDDE